MSVATQNKARYHPYEEGAGLKRSGEELGRASSFDATPLQHGEGKKHGDGDNRIVPSQHREKDSAVIPDN